MNVVVVLARAAVLQRLEQARVGLRPALNMVFMVLLPSLGVLGAVVSVVQGRVTGMHLALFVVGFFLTGFGITVGYHRLITHRSFETHPALKAILLIFGSMAVEGPVREWVSLHLQHHANSDQDGDPHSPTEGFFHAHWGWMFHIANQRNGQYGVTVDRDPVASWVSDTFMVWVGLGYAIPFLLGGWEGLCWGGLARQLAVQHVTFAVNSACHRWGTRPFATNDYSRNNFVVGLLGLGEGWHNNHHAFPRSAFHGLRWWEVDLSGRVIRGLELARLAWNVRRPTGEQVRRKRDAPAANAGSPALG